MIEINYGPTLCPFSLLLLGQDDGLVGVPSKLNRYKRAGTRAADNTDPEEEGDDGSDGDGGDEKKTAPAAMDSSLEDGEGEGDVGGGAGLTLIKIRLFKEVKKDEASIVWKS